MSPGSSSSIVACNHHSITAGEKSFFKQLTSHISNNFYHNALFSRRKSFQKGQQTIKFQTVGPITAKDDDDDVVVVVVVVACSLTMKSYMTWSSNSSLYFNNNKKQTLLLLLLFLLHYTFGLLLLYLQTKITEVEVRIY